MERLAYLSLLCGLVLGPPSLRAQTPGAEHHDRGFGETTGVEGVLVPGAEEGVEEIEEADFEVAKPFDPLDPDTWRPEVYPVLDRVVNIPTPLVSRPGSGRFVVDHRTFQPWTENAAFDGFGFDAGGLKIGLGLRFGLVESLEVGLYRLNDGVLAFDTYEFDVKWQALRQEDHLVNLAVRAGGTWFAQEDAEDAGGGFAQLVVDRLLWGRVLVGAGVFYHSDSTDDSKTADDTDWSLAVPAYVDVRILAWLAWNVEMAANVAGFGARWPNFSSSVKIITNRHTFALVISNNQYFAADGIVANSDRGFDDLIIGFSITREW